MPGYLCAYGSSVSGVVFATRDVYLPFGTNSHIFDLNEWFESRSAIVEYDSEI